LAEAEASLPATQAVGQFLRHVLDFSGKTLDCTKVDPGLHEANSASVSMALVNQVLNLYAAEGIFLAQLSDAVNGLADR
jgi:hypothetical protein